MSIDLSKIEIRHAPLSDRILIARFGSDPSVALDTRDADDDFWKALVSYAFERKMPEPGDAVEIKFGGEGEQYTLTIKREAATEGESGQ